MLADPLGLVRVRIRRNRLLQGTITLADNARVMNKNIGTVVMPDKTVPLGIVEPLHFPLHLLFVLLTYRPLRWSSKSSGPFVVR